MFPLFVWALLIGSALSQIPNKVLLEKQAVGPMAVKIFTQAELSKDLSCVHDSIYKEDGLMVLGAAAASCVTSQTPMVLAKGMALLPGLEACLLTCFSTTTKVCSTAAQIVIPEITPIYNKVIAKVKAAKKNKLTKDKVMNQAYAVLLENVNKPLVERICTLLSQKLPKKQFDCLIRNAASVIDLKQYKCADAAKANILG